MRSMSELHRFCRGSEARIRVAFTSVYPLQAVFAHVLAAQRAPPAPADPPQTVPPDVLTRSAAGGNCPASGRSSGST